MTHPPQSAGQDDGTRRFKIGDRVKLRDSANAVPLPQVDGASRGPVLSAELIAGFGYGIKVKWDHNITDDSMHPSRMFEQV